MFTWLSFRRLAQKSGVKRTVGGGVTGDNGLIPALSDLAKRFMSEPDARVSIQVLSGDDRPFNATEKYVSGAGGILLLNCKYDEAASLTLFLRLSENTNAACTETRNRPSRQ